MLDALICCLSAELSAKTPPAIRLLVHNRYFPEFPIFRPHFTLSMSKSATHSSQLKDNKRDDKMDSQNRTALHEYQKREGVKNKNSSSSSSSTHKNCVILCSHLTTAHTGQDEGDVSERGPPGHVSGVVFAELFPKCFSRRRRLQRRVKVVFA